MVMQQRDKCGTAGGRHLAAFFPGLDPFLRLIGSCHIAAKAYLHHVSKADFFQCRSDGCHTDVIAKLPLGRRRAHGNHPLAGLDRLDNINYKDL